MNSSSSFNLFEINDTCEAKKTRIKSILDFKQTQKDASLQAQEDVDSSEILVFGYACKLFHDSETALKLENDSNLIPWNGDTNLLIDRYDGRGYLFDLSPFDSDFARSNTKIEKMSQEEIEIEYLCDQERYKDLNKQIEADSVYQEEEMKRFYTEQHEYAAVKHSYAQDSQKKQVVEGLSQEVDVKTTLEVFVPSKELKLPPGMLIPETKKHNMIIEKTANFVASKGLQMEILIKAKQSANSMFNFLNYEDSLNAYYKHLVEMIKTGKYVPNLNDDKTDSEDSDDDENGGSYLHPLLSKNMTSLTNKANKSEFKPNIKDSPYNALIEKFTSHTSKQNALSASSSSKSNNEPSVEEEGMQIPEDLKRIIDKLADYVVRNGSDFEECIKQKNEERFSFLNKEHAYHKYYQFKIQQKSKNINKCLTPHANDSLTASNDYSPKIVNSDEEAFEKKCTAGNQTFTDEQKAARKLKAAMFLSSLNSSKQDADKKPINSEIKAEETALVRSRSQSSEKHKSQARHRKPRHRPRSRSRSRRRTKNKHRSSSSTSRKRHRSSRSHSRHRKSSKHDRKHKKSRRTRDKRSSRSPARDKSPHRKKKNRSRSRSKTS